MKKRISISILAAALMCALAWLVGNEDAMIAAMTGTLCVTLAAICMLWRDALRHLFTARRDSAAPAAPGLSVAAIAGIMLLLLLFMASRGSAARTGTSVWVWVALAVSIGLIAHAVRRWRGRRSHRAGRHTSKRGRSAWTPPPSIPTRGGRDSDDTLRKTRPMPPI